MRTTNSRRALALTAVATLLTACAGGGATVGETGGGRDPLTATTGFDGSTITLGVLSPLSGPAAVFGRPMTSGNEVWFKHINSQGGIGGKYPVRLVEEDTQYRPDLTVQRYNKVKGDVVAFTQLVGTTPTLALLPLLTADKILAAPASGDAVWVRKDNLLPITAPYQIQSINAVDHYLTERGGTPQSKICTMIQDDAYGEAGQQGIDFAAQRYGFTVTMTQRYKLGTENYAGQIGALAGAGCEMVFLAATPTDAGKIWGAAAQARFTPKWYGQAPSYAGALAESPLASYLQQHVLIAYEGTEWGDQSVPGMKDLIDRVSRFAPQQQPDLYFTFGYNQARAMTAVLEKAVELGDLSRDGVLSASRELGTVSFDGLSGDYVYGRTDTRNPPRTTTLFRIDPAKPFGLATLKYNFTSDAAKAYPF
ncbi:ABC-type branched-chain amino acid transport system, substrate-binding protein [Actinokineospora alba]|uniref:ABC-type branched-chain amino acid transport system, substrate-binding protein n=2 Tax=Actinokineospora alba TaxID=504798 RepID=A0A1H0F7B5_9PSEU|nr:ABC transporter substrate-binding protein [Actinokineospora alba]TDP69369.1 ABC-type branched-subunit amino acid transport system substrate-binding protein [Actinokineospora alba]SDI18235.1 ABC-type branched-chain amino acid transport system, substrate-binding protein [Actinokineospora alba]SDN90496.1 ABC-type branched-chain amino acid transport system, substrate-binding protein [Actinokineospora alba]